MFKDIFKNWEKDKIKWPAVIFALLIGLFLIIDGNPLDVAEKPAAPLPAAPQDSVEQTADIQSAQPSMAKEEQYLANKLKEMLEQVEGAGQVEVTVRLKSSSRSEYAINTSTGTKTTQEKDQAGGTRVLTEDTDTGQLVLIRGKDGTEIPVLQQETAPEVSGVLVVAEGAGTPEIKAELFRAVQVGLGVEPQKILVLSKQ